MTSWRKALVKSAAPYIHKVGFLLSMSISIRFAQSPPLPIVALSLHTYVFGTWFLYCLIHRMDISPPSSSTPPVSAGCARAQESWPASRYPGMPSPVEKSSPRGVRHPPPTSALPDVHHRPQSQPGRPLYKARGYGVCRGKGEGEVERLQDRLSRGATEAGPSTDED